VKADSGKRAREERDEEIDKTEELNDRIEFTRLTEDFQGSGIDVGTRLMFGKSF